MKFSIFVDCSNAAFEDLNEELRTILTLVGDDIEGGAISGPIRDSNGNQVGSWQFTKE